MKACLLALFLLASPGCGCISVMTWVEGQPLTRKGSEKGSEPDLVFSGVRSWNGFFARQLEKNQELRPKAVGKWALATVLFLFDFPFSLGLDLLALPVTVPISTMKPDPPWQKKLQKLRLRRGRR